MKRNRFTAEANYQDASGVGDDLCLSQEVKMLA